MQLCPGLVFVGLLSLVAGRHCRPREGSGTDVWEGRNDVQRLCREQPTLEACTLVNALEDLEQAETELGPRSRRSVAENETDTSPAVHKREVEMQGMTEGEEAPEEWLGAATGLEKRFEEFRGRGTEGEGYKRGPGFRSWGGKRGPGGNKFSNWGGKRAETEYDDPEAEKRKFSSWGGKRDPFLEAKRKFNSWGGKRAGGDEDLEAEKRKFSSWGGKRSDETEDCDDDDFEVQKRPQFQSWGGKRAYPLTIDGKTHFYIRRGDLTRFLNWGGKRKFSSWGGKRSDPTEEKRYFQPWGGKRDTRVRNKPSFQSWGGKRSEGDEEKARLKRSYATAPRVLYKPVGFRAWAGRR